MEELKKLVTAVLWSAYAGGEFDLTPQQEDELIEHAVNYLMAADMPADEEEQNIIICKAIEYCYQFINKQG